MSDTKSLDPSKPSAKTSPSRRPSQPQKIGWWKRLLRRLNGRKRKELEIYPIF